MKKLFGSVNLVDLVSVPSQRTYTKSGQLIVPCKFARTGSMEYTAGSLGLEGRDPSEIVKVFRDETEVFNDESLASFRSAPLTIGHPKSEDGKPLEVTAENAKDFQVGSLEGMPVRDEDFLAGTLVVARKDAIDLIEKGTVELSAGYTCDLMIDEEGSLFQTNIRANHIAIVSKGRAGNNCRIADEGSTVVEDVAELTATIATLTDERNELKDKLDAAEAKLDASEAKVIALQESLNDSVEELVENIIVARDISDVKEFKGKTVAQIQKEVVCDQMPDIDLEGKSEAYVSAMFDILVDSASKDSPMGKLLRKHVVDTAEPETYVDPVAVARKNMIERNKKRSS